MPHLTTSPQSSSVLSPLGWIRGQLTESKEKRKKALPKSARTKTITLMDYPMWHKEAVMTLVGDIDAAVYDAEHALSFRDEPERNEYRVGLLMPLSAIEKLKKNTWKHTRIDWDESKTIESHGQTVFRVGVCSRYRRQILPSIALIAKRQALTLNRHKQREQEQREIEEQGGGIRHALNNARLGRQHDIVGTITKKWLPDVPSISRSNGLRRYRATIRLDDGFVATGTLPASLDGPECGMTIVFSATFLVDTTGLKFTYPRITSIQDSHS